MHFAHSLVRWNQNGLQDTWTPVELCRIGKSEEYLEIAIASTRKLLSLESRRTAIRGPFAGFRQCPLPTPTNRVVFPDIIFLTASGHVIAVEVKLSNNPELRQRDVIAQIIDYASSLSRLDQGGICRLLDKDGAFNGNWYELVHHHFPGQADLDELADVFLERLSSGRVNIVIACDKLPPGTAEMVSSISSQATLGFECDVVEIVPYIREPIADGEIVFVPSIRLSTEIVARTVVEIIYRTGDPKPQANVQVTGVDEIAAAIEGIKGGQGRIWTEEETAAKVESSDDPVLKDLFLFAKAHSDDGQVVTQGLKQNANFGLHLRSSQRSASAPARCIFSCTVPWHNVTVFLGTINSMFAEEIVVEFRQRLQGGFGSDFDMSKSMPGITTARLKDRLEDFKSIMTWLISQSR